MRRRLPMEPMRLMVLVLWLFVAACGGEGQTEAAREPRPAPAEGTPDEAAPERASITVAPTSPSKTSVFASYYIADALGYYDEENLDVELTTAGGGSVQAALLAGRLDFGGVSQANFIPLLDTDGPQPLQWFMNQTMYGFMVFVPDASEYQTADDLVGTRIGVPESADIPTLNLLMSLEGVDPGQYEAIPVGGRSAFATVLDQGDIAAAMGTSTDQSFVEEGDIPTRVIEMGDTSNWYNGGPMARTELLENDAELAVRFGRALAKGIVFQYTNPEAALAILAEEFPGEVEGSESELVSMQASMEVSRAAVEDESRMDGEIWQSIADAYHEHGVIQNEVDMSKVFTNDLLDDIWDFDVEAIEQEAESYGA